MIELLKKEIESHGHKYRIVSIDRIDDLKKDLSIFSENQDLNNFQKYIINNMYKFEVLDLDFIAKSIIIIAVPNPAYANVEFIREGKKYLLKSLALSDVDTDTAPTVTMQYLKKLLEPKKYHISDTPDLPLKRLSVRSGLAVYGRNNICYVDGMGSFLTFVAYFTDVSCAGDSWEEIKHADICINCKSCVENCPTGAIRDNRFLLDNERCLSYYNERPGEFPDWIPLTAHNCVYDCLKCQIDCPVNKPYLNNIIGLIKFNEEETNILIKGKQFNELNPELQKKCKILGMDLCFGAVPRNLKILFELNKQ